MTKRTISVSHLVFGLIFLGAAALWSIGAATDADAPDLAVVAPAVLIGAGVAGLIATVLNARNSWIRTAMSAAEPADEPVDDLADTTVLDDAENLEEKP